MCDETDRDHTKYDYIYQNKLLIYLKNRSYV